MGTTQKERQVMTTVLSYALVVWCYWRLIAANVQVAAGGCQVIEKQWNPGPINAVVLAQWSRFSKSANSTAYPIGPFR